MRCLLGLAALALAAGLAFPESAVRSGAPWQVPCPFDARKALLPVTCGRMKVPENPERPGRVVEIAFMVVKAPRAIDQHGPMVFLNGGPGEVSLYDAEQLVTKPYIRDVVVDRDWIFFDQRGAGRSMPALRCEEPGDDTAQVRACKDRLAAEGIDLSQYNSVRIVGDLEAMRRALGVNQLNLWGVSYGARLAVIAARMYPTSVHAIILDAADLPEGQELVDDARGTEVALNKLFAKCAADPACAAAYPQLRDRFNAALPRLRQTSLMVGERRFDDAALLEFIRNWMYPRGNSSFERRLQGLLAVMDAAARGDARTVGEVQKRMRTDEGLDNPKSEPPLPAYGQYSLGLNMSVYCHESEPFADRELRERAVASSAIVRALLQGSGDGGGCGVWPAGKATAAARSGYYDGPQLVFTGELDASSSGSVGYEIAKQNAFATHVVFRDGMHVQFRPEPPTPEDAPYRMCALQLARAFVADPRRRLDTGCADTRQLRLVR